MAGDRKDVTSVTDCLVFFDRSLVPKGDWGEPVFPETRVKAEALTFVICLVTAA